MENQKIRHIFVRIGAFFLRIAGFSRIDVAFDKETRIWSGMVFSSSESFTSEYQDHVLDLIHYEKKYGKI